MVAGRPTSCLGPIHRGVGGAQDFRGAALLVGVHGDDADAGPDLDMPRRCVITHGGDADRLAQRRMQPPDQSVDFDALYRCRQQRDELIAADSADDVIRAQSRPESLRGDFQDRVARMVTQLVVDYFELVKIYEKDSAPTVFGRSDRIVDQCHQVGAVGQPGQDIVRWLGKRAAGGHCADR